MLGSLSIGGYQENQNSLFSDSFVGMWVKVVGRSKRMGTVKGEGSHNLISYSLKFNPVADWWFATGFFCLGGIR